MHGMNLVSLKDTLLVAIPFLAILALSLFRLDTIFGASRPSSRLRRPPCGIDENGEPLLVDPDGRIAQARHKRK